MVDDKSIITPHTSNAFSELSDLIGQVKFDDHTEDVARLLYFIVEKGSPDYLWDEDSHDSEGEFNKYDGHGEFYLSDINRELLLRSGLVTLLVEKHPVRLNPNQELTKILPTEKALDLYKRFQEEQG